MASSSTATHNQTELENAFEQPAPDSTRSPKRFQASSSTSAEPSRVSQQTQPDPQNAFDQLAPFRASTSTEPCQIFINHRGSDVKYTLASKIYQTLDGMGFRAFLDVEALEPGDVIPAEIQAAMTSASLHIAIFSPNYAQSPWCLAELSFMLKTGAKIIPIFYLVKPDDLRWIEQGKGVYAQAFSEHRIKGRYTQEKLDEWKKALYDISFHSGWLVNNNEDEGRVLKNIVNCAFKVMKNVSLWVAEHPLGLEELVQDFESAVSVEKVKVTGIVGMGGSGKTTLAKELFNRNFFSFERCSFVSDVRVAASRKALHDKQKKLLEDLDVHHSSFDNVDEGKAILANRLRSLRVLIVLDDVDHIDQVNALLPRISDHIDRVNALPDNHTLGCNLGSQSMVILTTRELGVLKSCGLSPSCIYQMPRLNSSHAEQLFCWHAFLKPSPPTGFETLVQKFIEACDGLPLSLKVLGGQLYGRDSRDYWESQLNKISRIMPGDIKERLQVSYDALDEEEKEMFLDVACFLIGERKSTAIAVWDGMQLSGLHGFETLVNKCLVEVVREWHYFHDRRELSEKIKMHDHLRDMGREIASGRSPYRLWCPEQIDNIKNHFKKKMLFRGIWPAEAFVALKEYTYQLMGNSSRRSKRLRLSNGLQILSVKGNEFTEEFASLSEDLVWLRWKGFPLRNIPSWLTLRHLSVLELHCDHVENELKELWDDNADPPLQLRELIISDNYNLQRLPSSIGRLQYLKKLSITFHGSSLPKEFYGLQSLEYLNLRAPALSTLSAGFGNLRSLRNIKLADCKLSTLPDSFSQLIHLEELDLSDCRMLSSLPVGFGNLISLKRLSIFSCKQLSTLPDSLSQLIHLKLLNSLFCEMLSSLPVGFGNLISLKYLCMSYCKQLSTLPDSFSQLIHLEYLDLSDCKMLSSLPVGFGNLISLKRLNLSQCKQLSTLPDSFSQLIPLEDLHLSKCEMLSSLPAALGNLISLKHINLSQCKQLSTLPDSFKQLTHLEDLNLSECEMLSSLPAALGNLISLKHIDLSRCKQLSTLPDSFNQLMHLEDLNLSRCAKLKLKLDMLENIRKLKVLKLAYCEQLEDLPHQIMNQESLTKLNLRGCIKLRGSAANIGELVKLQSLKIENLMLESLQTSLVNFSSLKKMTIVNSTGLMGFDAGDEDCKQVSRLSISNDHCPILETFKVRGNRHLTEIETLPVSLKKLSIEYCKVLKSIRCISSLVRLKKLKISYCPQIEEFSSSAGLASLKEFSMENCPKVEQIEGLQHSKSLKKLSLEGTCWKVPGIQSLEKVERLEELVLECDTISALKPCIQFTKAKECLRRMEIKGSVSRFVKPIVNSLEFPHLEVREVENLYDAREIIDSLNSPTFSFNSPAFLCYVERKETIDSLNIPVISFNSPAFGFYVEGKEENDEESDVEESDVEVKEENDEERKVVSICVSLDDIIAGDFLLNEGRMVVYRAKVKAMVVAGEGGRVWEAFHQLLTLLE